MSLTLTIICERIFNCYRLARFCYNKLVNNRSLINFGYKTKKNNNQAPLLSLKQISSVKYQVTGALVYSLLLSIIFAAVGSMQAFVQTLNFKIVELY